MHTPMHMLLNGPLRTRFTACLLAITALLLPVAVLAAAFLQEKSAPTAPTAALQPRITAPTAGSVAPYVDSPRRDVERMLDLAQLGPNDVLMDLGSGDGRIVIAAAGRGALALGVEIEPELVARARDNARRAGVADRARFVEGDIFDTDFKHATVVTLYLFPEANLALRPLLLAQLAPGTRVLSNSFHMGEWQPDLHVEAATSGGILMWHVPAVVAGRWQLQIDAPGADAEGDLELLLELLLEQRFQQFYGVVKDAGGEQPLRAMALEGARIRFETDIGAVPHRFSGRVDGERISGVAFPAGTIAAPVRHWSASRLPAQDDS